MPRLSKIFSRLSVLPLILLLSGCNMVVMAPSGDIAVQQRDLIVVSTVLMLLIIVPVIFLTLFFAWKYRQSNTAVPYDPEWHHSTRLELVIWSAPLAIIIALGAVTWISTHQLDPFRPLDRIREGKPVTTTTRAINVEVVALDWKWLFFYPDLGIATVNELAAPVDAPINFRITASSVMNSFFVPALAGQIYAMPGMETQLHAVINKAGEYQGMSANYSGAGFSNMRFMFHGQSQADFDQWVQKVKSQGTALGRQEYLALAKPSEREPVRYFNAVDSGLYDAILNMCADPSKMCASEMMHIDAKGGAGKDSQENRERLIYNNRNADAGDVTPVKAGDTTAHDMQHGDNSMQGMDMGNMHTDGGASGGSSSASSAAGSSTPAQQPSN